jgi:UDP-GlcNAc:undecaprenyl-phosphate GlcNAc-1-phosphate transferase
MRTAAISFLISLVLAAALTPMVRAFAIARGWFDYGLEARKVHGRPIPRLGGVAIVLAFYAPILGMLLYPTGMAHHFFADPTRAYALMLGGLAIAALGLYDDLRGAGALIKLIVQLGVACALWFAGFRIEELGLPGFGTHALGILAMPVTVFWIVGVVNAMNLIDGLDGLAGGIAFLALGTSFVVAFSRGDATMALLCAALAGSVFGFLVYNFNPASIFMGDTGSMFLGFILAAGAIQTSQKASTAVALLAPLISLGLPIADTALAILRRASAGRPIFSADREHIHHRLLARGLSHRQAVLVLYGLSFVLCAFALAISFANNVGTAITLSGLALVGVFASRQLSKSRLREGALQTVISPRAAIRGLSLALSECRSPEELFRAIGPAAEALGLVRLTLKIDGCAPFQLQRAAKPSRPVLRWPLGDESMLELVFADGRGAPDHEQEVAIEVLVDLLMVALARIQPAVSRVPPLKMTEG